MHSQTPSGFHCYIITHNRSELPGELIPLPIDMVLCSGGQARQLIAVADKINARVVAISSGGAKGVQTTTIINHNKNRKEEVKVE